MKRSQVIFHALDGSYPRKLRVASMMLLIGVVLVACTAEPADYAAAPVSLAPQPTSLAPLDQQLHESSLTGPTGNEANTEDETAKESDAASEKPTESAWKKSTDAQKVASDAKAAGKQPATAKAVDLDQNVQAGPETQMRIKRIEQTESEAEGIGQIAGPATLVEIELFNQGSTQLDLSKAQLRLFYGEDLEPAAVLTDSRSSVLPAQLAAGKKTTAIYLFSAHTKSRTEVTLEFETGATKEIQQLAGEVSP